MSNDRGYSNSATLFANRKRGDNPKAPDAK
jgi:hypothetical protein